MAGGRCYLAPDSGRIFAKEHVSDKNLAIYWSWCNQDVIEENMDFIESSAKNSEGNV